MTQYVYGRRGRPLAVRVTQPSLAAFFPARGGRERMATANKGLPDRTEVRPSPFIRTTPDRLCGRPKTALSQPGRRRPLGRPQFS